jgi:DNA polymerase III subunit beta
MNFSIQREALLEPLQQVIGVVERRQTKPILANVLLAMKQDQSLSVIATDLEVQVVANTLFDSMVEQANITVSGRKLLDICRMLPPQTLMNLQKEQERLIIRAGQSRFVLATLPTEDFPQFEESQVHLEFAISQKELSNLLARTYFAMAQQDVRYYLNGMLFEIKQGRIIGVATDGHRFAMNSQAVAVDEAAAIQVIIPRKGVLELMRLLNNVDSEVLVILGQNHIRVQGEAFIFTSKLIDGRFPDYERILPRGVVGRTVVMSRELLRESLLRIAVLSAEKFRAVSLQLGEGLLRISSRNQEQQEEAEEITSVDYQEEPVEIAFNVNYLLDVLNTVADATVKLTFINTSNRMFVEEANNSDSLFLVMPLQL